MTKELWEKIWKIALGVIWVLVILVPVCAGFAWCSAVELVSTKVFISLMCIANLCFNGFGVWKWVTSTIVPLFKK